MNALDLTFLSIYRINSQEWPFLPGLLAQTPPKKLARGRDQDRLFVYLTLAGNVTYSASQYGEIVGRVADTFYSTPGSLTFALKTATSQLNAYLVECNMKSTGKGLYSLGALVLCNLRGDSMYIVQSGPTHVYYLAGETQHFYDPQLAGKGLGLSQTARMYFSHITFSPGERLLMCAALPPNWDRSISEVRGSTALDITRRRLLAITEGNVSALLVQASEGSGALNILRAVKDEALEAGRSAAPVDDPIMPLSIPIDKASEIELQSMAESRARDAAGRQAERKRKEKTKEKTEAVLPGPGVSPQIAETDQAVETPIPPRSSSEKRQSAPRAPRVLIPPIIRERVGQGVRSTASYLAGLIQNWHAFTKKTNTWVEKAIHRLLPDDSGDDPQPSSISQPWSIFFAVAIPVLLFVVARLVYYQWGYATQYKTYYDRAEQAAQQALVESVPAALRVEWQSALDWLDKADQYQLTPHSEAQKLRQDAQTALDDLDKIVRLDFILAFNTPLSKNVQVSRMVTSDSDLYLLDSNRGVVMRGIFNNKNYDLDDTFECGAGTYDGIQVGKLIDIVVLPRVGTTEATLLGIDSSGNLLYCIPGQTPRAAFLKMPQSGWKDITSIVYDASRLYVLDAPARAVWVYLNTEKIELAEPTFFFEEQVPVMLEEAIGMVINGDDLFLLHKDGHMATCTFSHINTSPTRCNDPALYIDTRLGYEGGITLSDGNFSQITLTSPPDPSVALLEPFTQSIYRFSLRALELQTQVRARPGKENPLPKGMPITAMVFSPNKNLFIFVNGQVYFSVNVP